MYVHIGKDIIIKKENIIAILDIESLEKRKKLEDICQELKISDKIIDVSQGNKKTLIITQDNKNKENKGYISNISSITLGKRTVNLERMEK